MLVGTVIGEMCTFGPGLPDRRTRSREDQLTYLRKFLGDKTEELVPLFEECYPGRPITDLVLLDTFSRVATKDFCRKKAEHAQSATYNYLFTFDFPIDDGTPAGTARTSPSCSTTPTRCLCATYPASLTSWRKPCPACS